MLVVLEWLTSKALKVPLSSWNRSLNDMHMRINNVFDMTCNKLVGFHFVLTGMARDGYIWDVNRWKGIISQSKAIKENAMTLFLEPSVPLNIRLLSLNAHWHREFVPLSSNLRPGYIFQFTNIFIWKILQRCKN